jgi:hypothetical protein
MVKKLAGFLAALSVSACVAPGSMIVENSLGLDIPDLGGKTISVGMYKGYGQHPMDENYGDRTADDERIRLDAQGRGVLVTKRIHHVTFWLVPPLGNTTSIEKPTFEIHLSDDCMVVPYKYDNQDFGLYQMYGLGSMELVPRGQYDGKFEKNSGDNGWNVSLRIRNSADICRE